MNAAAKEHPFRERRISWPDDMALRAAGFHIHDRPRGQEPIWERGGKLYLQRQAVELVKGADGER